MEGVRLQVRQRVGGCSGDRGEGAIIKPDANSLSKVGGEKILVVGHFLEVLPLAQLSHRVEAALAVEVMVEWFVFRDANAGRDVGFDVGKESPPPVGSFDSQGKIV